MSLFEKIAFRYQLPLKNWRVRDHCKRSFLCLLRDTLYQLDHQESPRLYNMAQHTILNTITLDIVAARLNNFVMDELPAYPGAVLTYHKSDLQDVHYESFEKATTVNLNYNKCLFQLCYEGIYLRAYRYGGKNHLSSTNKIPCERSWFRTSKKFTDIFTEAGVLLSDIFDDSVEYCDTILHLVVGDVHICERTHRKVVGPYVVLVRVEDAHLDSFNPSNIKPPHNITVVPDDLSQPLGVQKGIVHAQ